MWCSSSGASVFNIKLFLAILSQRISVKKNDKLLHKNGGGETMKKIFEILINQQFWGWWSGDPKGGNKMDEIWRTETLVIRYYKKAQEGVLLQTVTSFVKVVPWNLRLLNSGMMTESWIWSWFAFHPEALFMPIIDLSWANEIHVTLHWTILTAVNLVQPSFKSSSLQTKRWTNICKPHMTTNFIDFLNKSGWRTSRFEVNTTFNQPEQWNFIKWL